MEYRWSIFGGLWEEKLRINAQKHIWFSVYFFPENKKKLKIRKKVGKCGGKWGKMCNFERKFNIKLTCVLLYSYK